MNKNRSKLKILIKIVAVITLILSLYLTGLFFVISKMLDFSQSDNPFEQLEHLSQAFNPVIQFQYMRKYGFPMKTFLIWLFIVGFIAAALVMKHITEIRGMDKMGRLFKQREDRQSYGDSHFEEPEEYESVASIQSVNNAMGTILGQIGDDGTRVINFRMDNTRYNKHISVVGSSGSGKTYTFSKPYCYQAIKRRESIVFTDPDGGLYRDTAALCKKEGYIVRRFDLTNLLKSDGWDCMKSITKENVELDAQVFAHTIIANVSKDMESIYATGPETLLKALILRVYLGSDFPQEKKNIGEVYKLIQNPNGEEFLDQLFENAYLYGAKASLGPYLTFKQGSPNLRGNLITNLGVELQLLQNEIVCQVLSTDDIDLTLPGKRPCAYYCLFPDSHGTYSFIVALFFSMFLTNLINYADQKCGGSLPVPVNFLLDEFPSIGKLPDWDRKMSTIRKRNMNAVMIFQNITQIQNLYESTWSTIISNCDTMILLGINDGDSADLVSRRIGNTSIQVESEQHPANEAIFAFYHSRSEGEGKRELLSYDELHKIDIDDCLIIIRGHNPIWARKFPHTLHPASKNIPKILPSDIPDITDIDARANQRKEEEARIQKYENEHPEYIRNYEGLCESDDKKSSVLIKLKGLINKLLISLRTRNEGDSELESEIQLNEIEEFEFENDFKADSCPENDVNLDGAYYEPPNAQNAILGESESLEEGLNIFNKDSNIPIESLLDNKEIPLEENIIPIHNKESENVKITAPQKRDRNTGKNKFQFSSEVLAFESTKQKSKQTDNRDTSSLPPVSK